MKCAYCGAYSMEVVSEAATSPTQAEYVYQDGTRVTVEIPADGSYAMLPSQSGVLYVKTDVGNSGTITIGEE